MQWWVDPTRCSICISNIITFPGFYLSSVSDFDQLPDEHVLRADTPRTISRAQAEVTGARPSELWRLWPIASVIINSPHQRIICTLPSSRNNGNTLPADIPTWAQTEPHTSCRMYVSMLHYTNCSTFELLLLSTPQPTSHDSWEHLFRDSKSEDIP
jgi:hypothetical protein